MVVKGNNILIYIDNVAIGCLTGGTFTSNGNPIDVTCKDNDGAPQSLPSKGPWSISGAGNYNTDSSLGLGELLAARKNQTLLDIKYGSDVDGELYVIGQVYLDELTWSGDLNAASTISFTMNGTGDWNYGTAS